jgi:large subunit ribosomal protein L29
MKARDIRRRENGDLLQEVRRLEEEIFNRRFHSASEDKGDRGAIRKNRRDIARIHTILRERSRAESAPSAARE